MLFWIVSFLEVGAAVLLGKPFLLFAPFARVKLLFEVGAPRAGGVAH